jgi:Holliday junction resolvasome RuvABC ATP-dependent DNA helicase subunit
MFAKVQEYFVFPEDVRRSSCKREATIFNQYVGQDGAVERLLDLVYEGYSNPQHAVRENVMLAGPPSTGKTTLVKSLVGILNTPAVLTDSNQVNKGISIAGKNISGGPDTIIHLILDAWARNRGMLRGVQAGSFAAYNLEAMTIFIDEIHGLSRKSSDALLKATERSDGMLFGKDSVMDTKNVLWIGATTDWGKLSSAFRTRFMRIDLYPPSAEEVATIVQLNTGWNMDTCRKVVFYGSTVAREALAFARSIERYAIRVGATPADCVWACAQREGIDQFGMRRQRIEILQALMANPDGMILRNLCSVIFCEAEEMVKHWLPPLLFVKPALVKNDDNRYVITEAGVEELKKRKLA